MSKYFSFLRKKRPSLHDSEDGDSSPKGKRKSGGGRKSSSHSPRSSKSSSSSRGQSDNRHSVHSLDFYDEMKEISSGADPFYSDNDSVLDSASVGDISVETDERERKFVGGTNGGMVTVFGDSEAFDAVGVVKVSHVDVEEDEGHVVDDENDDLIDDFMDEALDDLENDSPGVNEVKEATKKDLGSHTDEDNTTSADSTEDVSDIVEEKAAEIILMSIASEVSDLPANEEVVELVTRGDEITDAKTEVSSVDGIDEIEMVIEEDIETGSASTIDVEIPLDERESSIYHEGVDKEKAQNIGEPVAIAEGGGESWMEGKQLEEEEEAAQCPDIIPEEPINEVTLEDNKKVVTSGEGILSSEVCLVAEVATTSQGENNAAIYDEAQASVSGDIETVVGESPSVLSEETDAAGTSTKDLLVTDNARTSTKDLLITDNLSGLEVVDDSGKGAYLNIDITDSTCADDANKILFPGNRSTPDFAEVQDRKEEIKDASLCHLETLENKIVLAECCERIDEHEYPGIASQSIVEVTNKTIIEPNENIDQEQTSRECNVRPVSSIPISDDQVTTSNDKSLTVTEVSASDNKALKEGGSPTQPPTGDMMSPSSSALTSEVDEEEFDSAKEELSNTEDEAVCQNRNLVIDNLSRAVGVTTEPLVDAPGDEVKFSAQDVVVDVVDDARPQREAERSSRPENVEEEPGSLRKNSGDLNNVEASPIISSLDACEKTVVSSSPLVSSEPGDLVSSEPGVLVSSDPGDFVSSDPRDLVSSDAGDLFRSDSEPPAREPEIEELIEKPNLCRRISRSYSTQSSCESGVPDSDSGRKRRVSLSGRRNSTSEIGGPTFKRRGSSSDFAGLLAGSGKVAPESTGKQTVTEENFLLFAVNADYLEAEARLAQRRAARAEARELRLRDLEKQQQQHHDQQETNEEEEQYAANSSLPPHEGPATKTPSTPRARSSMPVNCVSRRSSEESIPDDLPASARELKETLQELEEKFRKAMVTNAQLDNEKATLTYEVEFLKDKYSDLEEAHIQLTKEHKKKCSENEQLRKLSNKLKEEVKMVRRVLQERDELIQEYGLVLIGEENGEESSYDDFEDEERKDDTINDLSPRKIGVKKALLSQEASELLAKGAAKGSLDVRLRKYAEDKHLLEDEVRRLKLLLEEELSRQRRENGLDYEKQKETSKSLNECKFRIQKAEAEVATLQANVIRLESLVARYKSSTEELEKSEEDLKAEKRRLQRELREVKEHVDELETSKAYVKRQYEKLLHERGRV